MATNFLGKIARRIMATSSNDLDRFPTENCELLANWAMKNFAYGPRVLFRKVGAWEREDLPSDGHIVLTMRVDYRDRMVDRWDKGVFLIKLDRTGFPVYAEAASEARVIASQTDFTVLSKLTSFKQLESIRAPFSEELDTMRPIADWALENIDLGDNQIAIPEGDWKVNREHGSVLFSREATFTLFATNGKSRLDKQGTFFVAFGPDGTPAGAWARSDSRPFALRERGHFPDVDAMTHEAQSDSYHEPRSPSP